MTTPVVPLTGAEVSAVIGFRALRPEQLNRVLRWELPAGTTQGDVQEVVDHVVARHEILRSRLVVSGPTLGRVVDEATRVPLLHAGVGTAAGESPITPTAEWPARWYLLDDPGPVLICVVHHTAAGWRGGELVEHEVRTLLDGRSDELGVPLQLSTWLARRCGADRPGRRERARQFVRDRVRDAEALALPVDSGRLTRSGPLPDTEPSRCYRLSSTVLGTRLDGLATSWNVSRALILLAAVGGALGRWQGGRSLPWRVLTDLGGAQPDGTAVVSYEPFVGLVTVPDDRAPLDQRARLLADQWLRSLHNSTASHEDMLVDVHAQALDRGSHVDLPLWFNFAAEPSGWQSAAGPEVVSLDRFDRERTVTADIGVFVSESDTAMIIELYPHRTGLPDDVARGVLQCAHTEIAAKSGRRPTARPAPLPTAEHPADDGPAPALRDGAGDALIAAVRVATAVPDPQRSFLEQAPLRAIPAVLDELESAGWGGLGPVHLTSTQPLGELARALERLPHSPWPEDHADHSSP